VGELLLVNRLVTAGLMHSRRWMIIPTLMSCSNASIDVDPSSRRPTLQESVTKWRFENQPVLSCGGGRLACLGATLWLHGPPYACGAILLIWSTLSCRAYSSIWAHLVVNPLSPSTHIVRLKYLQNGELVNILYLASKNIILCISFAKRDITHIFFYIQQKMMCGILKCFFFKNEKPKTQNTWKRKTVPGP
jgi:hypothetical protein